MDEGRTVCRRENHVSAADLDAAGRVAGVLRELRRRRADDLFQHARLEADAKAFDFCPGAPPVVERHRIVAKLDADFGENAVGHPLDPLQVLLAEDVIGRYIADDVGDAEILAALAPLRSPAPGPFRRLAGCFRHFHDQSPIICNDGIDERGCCNAGKIRRLI
jgi:hypothetical protein